MDFDLTNDQRKACAALREAARDLFDEAAAAPAEYRDRDAWRSAAGLGMAGLCLPREFGGGGLGALDTALRLEAFGAGCADTGLVFALAAHLLACAVPVSAFASDATRKDLLPGMSSAELIAANAMTEDEAGSDVGRLATTAVLDGDAYVLDGVKSFASNAPIADVFVTYATTDTSLGFLGISAFAVPRDLPGITVSAPMAKMGLHGCAAGRVEFHGCRVPARLRLGAEGQGSAVFQYSMGWERACLPALYLGVMEEQLERCVAHARTRRQFGHPIAEFQAVSHRLAAMRQRLEGARWLLYRACWLLDRDREEQVAAAALAKTAVSEAAVANSLDAVQVFGGSGYLAATGIERNLRDSVPAAIFSGTTEMQREILVRKAGL
ncbi:acyl-CoA dehydrogenase family protein [Streptomyces cyanogenus]|uniref:Acyl-CoA dehydrogenase n=1 Tax=Streptomyces cyanogenus TaxID=80860 RepID=A0ABX7TM63_STRCY|nr:acyl-CoA dehydrogenase family protein [Streptomyces cyanogenus]QTD96688.1 Acyl-CoA dehydrogenase [Streptomyces cyanogenus]